MKKVQLAIIGLLMTTATTAQNQDPWTEYMTPSEVHTLLAHYTGDFNMEISMSMGPDKEPAITTVISQHTMLFDGRFLEMKQHGTMMGMDYQSVMTLGFNNSDKKMTLTTLTNMGTGTLCLVGKWVHTTNTATLHGPLTNPVSKKVINVTQVITFIDKDTLLIESYDQEGNNPKMKTVQYKLTRTL